MAEDVKFPSEDQVKVFAAKFQINLSDSSQIDGVVGSLIDLKEGRGTLPEWMKDEPCFAELVASREPKAEMAAEEPSEMVEAPAAEPEV